MTSDRYLGTGWAVPLRPDPRGGGLDYAAGPDKVQQSIFIILDTEPGERVMRPTFGCGLRRYLMAPNTTATRALIQRDVESALTAWEPRVRVNLVQVSPGDDPSEVLIEVFYTLVRDGSPGNLVYPFNLA
jgi:phage baseplate assembly protein W